MQHQQLIARFNHPDTVLVISKYPYEGFSNSYHGVAVYTQDVLSAISEKTKRKFVVLVQREYDRPLQLDPKNENILIVPAFDGNSKMFAQLLRWVMTFRQASLIHIHSEFYTSGKPLQMAAVVPFMATLKLLGKKIYFTAHNVVNDFSFLASHLGKKQNDLSLKLIEKLTPWYYKCLSWTVNSIVVLDSSIAQKLQKYVHSSKLYISPLWIQAQKTDEKGREQLRKKYGFKTTDHVLLCYGFMTSYKGVDWLIEAVDYIRQKYPTKNIKLVLAGGKAPSQTGKPHYERYYSMLEQKVAKTTHMVLTGFIPEKKVKDYFSMADLVVLPYRGILGASASWGQAMAHSKPFLISQELQPYLESSDITQLLAAHGLTQTDLLFKRHRQTFANVVIKSLEKQKLATLTAFSKDIALERSAERRIAIEFEQLYTPQARVFSLQWNRATDIA